MAPFNPFIELAKDPITVLGYTSYFLFLLGVTIVLAGRIQDDIIYVYNAVRFRRYGGKYGDRWEYVVPSQVYLRVAGLILLLAIEAMLLAGLGWLLTMA